MKFEGPQPIEEKLRRRIRTEAVSQKYPSLVKEWTRTNFYGPDLFGPGSRHLVMWTCDQGHTYVRRICNRTSALRNANGEKGKNGCLICDGAIPAYADSLQGKRPDVACEWHAFCNGSRTPREIYADSDLVAFWRCACGHTFRMRVSARTQTVSPQGCPKCEQGQKVDLLQIHGSGMRFDLELNYGFDPAAVPESYLVFWRCALANHLSLEPICQLRDRGWQCLLCLAQESRRYLCDYPHLLEQLVAVEGEDADPKTLSCGSHQKATWCCQKGPDHVWTAPVFKRALAETDCPFCTNKSLSVTNSLSNFPEIEKEFHPKKNWPLAAKEIIAHSKRLLWWQCGLCFCEWQREVYLRTQRGSKCPKCKGKPDRAKRMIIENLLAISAITKGGRELANQT